MHFIYASDSNEPREPDSEFEAEAAICDSLGCRRSLIDFDALTSGSPIEQVVRRVKKIEGSQPAVYRGWMMTPEQYGALYRALESRGLRLLNAPAQYRHCHYLPENYPVIRDLTPRTAWLPIGKEFAVGAIHDVLRQFGDRPVIVKDYVKSQKHYWSEACFIPSASDREQAERVVGRFLELQDDSLAGGLVFREFVDLDPLATHSRSGMPLTKEFRIFYLDGEPVLVSEYWEEGEYEGMQPALEPFRQIAKQIESRFFAMDVARRKDGGWLIIELGDGQVSQLPDRSRPEQLYRALANIS
jgi:hypothetical protein